MRNPWLTIAHDAMRLGIDAQAVIALRLSGFARGKHGWKEAQRMVTEKAEALAHVQAATAATLLSGQKGPAVAKKALGIYGRRVRRNRRRLTRRSIFDFFSPR